MDPLRLSCPTCGATMAERLSALRGEVVNVAGWCPQIDHRALYLVAIGAFTLT